MDPVIGGSLIAAGSNIVGGFLNRDKGQNATHDPAYWFDRQERADVRKENIALQREFAQNGIRWKVADAKKAGLHPLYALGGSGASFSPSSVVGGAGAYGSRGGGNEMGRALSDAGQNIGRAVAATQSPEQRAFNAAQLQAIQSSIAKDEMQTAFFAAQIQKMNQQDGASNPIPNFNIGGTVEPGMYDTIKRKPDEVLSRASNFSASAAGTSPFWKSFEYAPGRVMDLPYSEEGPGESMENLSITTWPLVIAHNMKRYGAEWLKEAASWITPFLEKHGRGRPEMEF